MNDNDKIRILRQIRGYSQEYLAKQLGIAQSKYSEIETGQYKMPALLKDSILNKLGITPAAFEKLDERVFGQPHSDQTSQVRESSSIIDTLLPFVKEVSEAQKAHITALEDEVRFLRNLIAQKIADRTNMEQRQS